MFAMMLHLLAPPFRLWQQFCRWEAGAGTVGCPNGVEGSRFRQSDLIPLPYRLSLRTARVHPNRNPAHWFQSMGAGRPPLCRPASRLSPLEPSLLALPPSALACLPKKREAGKDDGVATKSIPSESSVMRFIPSLFLYSFVRAHHLV